MDLLLLERDVGLPDRLHRRHGVAVNPRRVKVEGDLFHGRVPEGAIYIGRAAPGLKRSRYCNPFPVKKLGVELSRSKFRANSLVVLNLEPLRGFDLACWCPLDAPWCHGDDLLIVANGGTL